MFDIGKHGHHARRIFVGLAAAITLSAAGATSAADAPPSEDEVGFSYERAVQHFPGLVREQIFVRIPLRWQWDISQNYTLKSYFEFAGGDMGRDGHDPTLISAGGQLRLDPKDSSCRVYYLVGFSPTVFANTTFGRDTMGTSLEFTTQLATGVYLGEQRKAAIELSLRHTSNGGLSNHNPGVNTLGMAVVYHF